MLRTDVPAFAGTTGKGNLPSRATALGPCAGAFTLLPANATIGLLTLFYGRALRFSRRPFAYPSAGGKA